MIVNEFKVKDLKNALKRFDDEESVIVTLSNLDDDSKSLHHISYGIKHWQRNGLTLELRIFAKYYELEDSLRTAKEFVDEKRHKIGKIKSEIEEIYKGAKRAEIYYIDFEDACELLKYEEYFFMNFAGMDDEADTYATILNSHPWIAWGFITPEDRRHLLLIRKDAESKDWLIHYPKELNAQLVIDIEKWDDLIMVTFDGKDHLIESVTNKENRIEKAKLFRKKYKRILKDFNL